MKHGVLVTCALLSACAFPAAVQRMNVEYNTAVSGMANELTLLNIVRAKEDLPLHFTRVSRLGGGLTLKGSASSNVAIRGNQTTDTTQTATAGSAVTTTVTEAILEGIDVVTPNVGVDVNTGPTFDVEILDTQKFYQGILSAIPFSTFENYIGQAYPDQLIMRLLIERINFRDGREGPNKGRLLFTWENAATGPQAVAFANDISCYRLVGRNQQRSAIALAPVSRLNRTPGNPSVTLSLEDLAQLDGSRLELSEPINRDPRRDPLVTIQRPRADVRVADLVFLGRDERTIAVDADKAAACRNQVGLGSEALQTPPPERVYLGDYTALVLGPDRRSDLQIRVEPEMVLRSTDSVIRFVGHYLRGREENPTETPLLEGQPLFSLVQRRISNSIVSTSLLGQRYSIANDANRQRNMLVLAIIQQLVNLHKESTNPPVTVPVRVVGGS